MGICSFCHKRISEDRHKCQSALANQVFMELLLHTRVMPCWYRFRPVMGHVPVTGFWNGTASKEILENSIPTLWQQFRGRSTYGYDAQVLRTFYRRLSLGKVITKCVFFFSVIGWWSNTSDCFLFYKYKKVSLATDKKEKLGLQFIKVKTSTNSMRTAKAYDTGEV